MKLKTKLRYLEDRWDQKAALGLDEPELLRYRSNLLGAGYLTQGSCSAFWTSRAVQNRLRLVRPVALMARSTSRATAPNFCSSWNRASLESFEAPVVELRVDVPANDREWRASEERERLDDAARGLERRRFGRVADAHAEAPPVAERLLDEAAEVRVVDDELGEARRREPLDLPFDERAPADFEQRLGLRVRERPQALPTPGCEDHRVQHRQKE